MPKPSAFYKVTAMAMLGSLAFSFSVADERDCGVFSTGATRDDRRSSFAIRHFEERDQGIFSFRQTIRDSQGDLVFNQMAFFSDQCDFDAILSKTTEANEVYFRLANPRRCSVHMTNSDPIERAFQPTFFDGLLISQSDWSLSKIAEKISEVTCLELQIE